MKPTLKWNITEVPRLSQVESICINISFRGAPSNVVVIVHNVFGRYHCVSLRNLKHPLVSFYSEKLTNTHRKSLDIDRMKTKSLLPLEILAINFQR